MENQNFIITIPEPCHEDWNKMLPDEKARPDDSVGRGKFCSSCNKSVYDFSNKTDVEVRNILLENKDKKVCGHFRKTQINREFNIHININNIPRNISFTKAFGIALFLVFGAVLFSCTNNRNQVMGKIAIENPQTENRIRGEVVMEEEEVPFIKDTVVKIQEMQIQTYNETHISGGVSMVMMPEIENAMPIADTLAPIEETYVVGQMAVFIPPQIDTTEVVKEDTSTTIEPKAAFKNPLLHKTSDFSIYPNPSKGEFTIKYDLLKRADIKVEIYDMAGALIKTVVDIARQYEGRYQIPVNISDLPNGIYIVNLINNGKLSSEKLIMEK